MFFLEGAFRIDVNVSVHKEGTNLGTRTEIKNVGSVHGVNHAIKEEIKRQLSIVQNGGVVKNETLTWDASNNKLIILRDKEDSQDYRFIPEPNLPPLRLLIDDSSKLLHQNVKSKHAIFDLQHLKEKIPVAPQKERVYLIEKYGLSDAYAYNLVVSFILIYICFFLL